MLIDYHITIMLNAKTRTTCIKTNGETKLVTEIYILQFQKLSIELAEDIMLAVLIILAFSEKSLKSPDNIMFVRRMFSRPTHGYFVTFEII